MENVHYVLILIFYYCNVSFLIRRIRLRKKYFNQNLYCELVPLGSDHERISIKAYIENWNHWELVMIIFQSMPILRIGIIENWSKKNCVFICIINSINVHSFNWDLTHKGSIKYLSKSYILIRKIYLDAMQYRQYQLKKHFNK